MNEHGTEVYLVRHGETAANAIGPALLKAYFVPIVTYRVGGFTIALFVRPPVV